MITVASVLSVLERPTSVTLALCVAHFPTHPEEISAATLDIARQIRSQYTIAYEPLNQSMDGSYREDSCRRFQPGASFRPNPDWICRPP